MPDPDDFELTFTPDYHLDEFDHLMRQLDAIGDRAVRTSVRVALQCDGRLVDAEDLAQEFGLDDRAQSIIKRLSEFGDESLGVHRFGAVHVAEINSGSAAGMIDLTTYLFARRTRGSQIKFWWETENGGEGDLLRVSEPLDFWGAVTLLNRALVAVAPYPVSDTWISGYFPHDPMLEVTVRSRLYPDLRRWFRAVVDEWFAAHRNLEER